MTYKPLSPKRNPNPNLEYDPNVLRAELIRVSGTINDEIETLRNATRVTQDTLNIEFTI
jgi:hypothetical protein